MIKRIGWGTLVGALMISLGLPWVFVLQGLPFNLPTPTAQLWHYPGIASALRDSLVVGLVASCISLFIASIIIGRDATHGKPKTNDVGLTFAAPHLAFAIAFLWLFTPFGWFDRVLPFALPWFEQQSLVTLITILVFKETPFLVVLGRQQLAQLPYRQWILQGRSVGTSAQRSWWLIVFPAWLKAMRLVLIAVAIYTVSVVDVAQVTGPLNPPLLAPLVVNWQLQFDPLSQQLAEQGTWLLMGLAGMMALWVIAQELVLRCLMSARVGRVVAQSYEAAVALATSIIRRASLIALLGVSTAACIALIALTFARGWFYPSVLPLEWSIASWSAHNDLLLQRLGTTLSIGLVVAVLATMAITALREWQRHHRYEINDAWLLAALFVPQLSLVVAWLHSDWSQWFSNDTASVVMAHFWFSFAYGYLIYAPAERAVPQTHLTLGRSLGFGYWRSWWWFKRPLLTGALAHCLLVTLLVSVAQYVPTLLLGAGRTPTLTTELVALSSGGEWQLPAMFATALWLLALVSLVLTQIISKEPEL
ncbi:Inner membrane ABC transporter permease protein YnjC [Pseudidiomarina piscicola]|uniref:Inner membrane ABC transporter permease protein YnjC n=1 Tax=Pseudidiomarina piscicola TaxID=2614830 RepID=A0A6S6WKL4_9GAMM|nr:hypothetical protein [Pseudidiomarina piscicola]CAB0150059.1 Inner membrane ABC transporter permease protein YnjC [Pseudidiomarina piscicola]VZT39501.1 Inner membrane ABC transporter permease protein YnjC [Pseudomonas aeruginosa]